MFKLNLDQYFKIVENLRIKSSGKVSCPDRNETNWYEVMQTGRMCRFYGLFSDTVWCYDQAIKMVDSSEIPKEMQKQLKSSILSAKAMCLSEMGNDIEAIELCGQALLLWKKNYEACCNKGIALKNLARYDEAITAQKKAISLHPKFPNSWNAIGHIMVDYLQDYKKAIGYLDKAIKYSGGKDACAWINKGNALSKLGRLNEAYTCWDAAYSIDHEKNVHAMLNKVIYLLMDEKIEDALDLLKKLKRDTNNNNPLYPQIADLHDKIEDVTK